MGNIDYQLIIASIINGGAHVIVLISSIIFLIKKQSLATILVFIGSLLITIGYFGSFIFNALAAQKSAEAIVETQIALTVFNSVAFFFFGFGIFLLALNFYKKPQTTT